VACIEYPATSFTWSELTRAHGRLKTRGKGTPLYQGYRYVPPQRVWFLSRFGQKTGIDFEKTEKQKN